MVEERRSHIKKSNYDDDEDDESRSVSPAYAGKAGDTTGIVSHFLATGEFRQQDLAKFGKNDEGTTRRANHCVCADTYEV